VGTGSSYPGVKWLGGERDHSSPSNVEVKNCRAIHPFPHTS
jgi:hypothetical protein